MDIVVENDDEIPIENLRLGKPELPKDNIIDLRSSNVSESCLLLLNQKIDYDIRNIWRSSKLKVCADGAANRLYEFNESYGFLSSEEELVPDFIVGDLDSISPKIKQYYMKKKTIVKKQNSQYATDFIKLLALIGCYLLDRDALMEQLPISNDYDSLLETYDKLLKKHEGRIQGDNCKVIVKCVGAIGGRFDHSIQSMTMLFKAQYKYPNLKILYTSKDDVIFFVPKGTSYIYNSTNGSTCGLLPIFKPVTLSTKGLKWDVTNWNSSMTGKVSSSNRIIYDRCVLHSNEELLMNVEI